MHRGEFVCPPHSLYVPFLFCCVISGILSREHHLQGRQVQL